MNMVDQSLFGQMFFLHYFAEFFERTENIAEEKLM